ncbi:ABC transporter substrate-binding protein [Phyllobacterium phragmitis]|uniref:ABC transporter substrate-binding protein n=1 Tax=Phyllobacterium phragmitis TaxID=2670329 RepID=A0A2S9IQT0_9HYPH|nr:ABC transporter substrate-binding protein [Phyllobacterium phragmitis]PRD42880.1 ABC transporter substrate-binding protein [Phyllobacterium phragmitis]
MTRLITKLGLAAGLALVTATGGVAQELPKNLRVVIGSTSTGGDTYQAASFVADAMSKHFGINAKVDAVGPTEAFKAIARDTRGTTIMIHHDQSYLGHLYGVKGYEDIFATYKIGPTLTVNPGNAYLVPKKSPYNSMSDILEAAAKGTRIRVAIQPGGVSEIGFSALKNAAKIKSPGSEANIVPVNTGSQADKDQLLFDGQADVINGSVQSNEQYTRLPEDDQKAMRFIWLTAAHETLEQVNEKGLGETSREALMEYATPKASVTLDGKTDFTFDKDFFILYNKEIDPAIIAAVDAGLKEIYAEGAIGTSMKDAFFVPHFLPSTEAAAYLEKKRDDYKKVIEAIRQ